MLRKNQRANFEKKSYEWEIKENNLFFNMGIEVLIRKDYFKSSQEFW